MNIVQRFKNAVQYYQPGNDRDAWQEFHDKCWSRDFSTMTPEGLKKVAYDCMGISSGADHGMWARRAENLEDFLTRNVALPGDDAVNLETLQYEFVATFLNDGHAAHNSDLWSSFNDSAYAILDEPITEEESLDGLSQYAQWALSRIPEILYEVIRNTRIRAYKPTEDSGTWNLYQTTSFNITSIPMVTFTLEHAFLLRDISSGPDKGTWSLLRNNAQSFLLANLGLAPVGTEAHLRIAVSFCNMNLFDYSHAAHNKDLFEIWNKEWSDAKTKLQVLAGEHGFRI